MYKRAIYWFKRDLRVEDNRGLAEAIKNSKDLIPIFIFIPSLIDKFKAYDKRLGFILDCIGRLSREIEKAGGTLFCFYDEPENVFNLLIDRYKPDAVFTTKAFSYNGEEIERKVENVCRERGLSFISVIDNFLANPHKIPYRKIYTPFHNLWREQIELEEACSTVRINTPKINESTINDLLKKLRFEENPFWKASDFNERIEKFDFRNYEKTRDRPDIDGTSKLSPYIRFGVFSLRRLYRKVSELAGEDSQFLKELAWREFWYHIKINFPELRDLELQEKRRGIPWENRDDFIRSFTEAKTGYPIIDAAIVQLKTEGWMHNRTRMIVASFLTKDLLVDWRIGERFFMEYLIDYDEVVNIGNWQWNASVGPDPKPLRIFNPVIQAQKFDPEGEYIKRYIPELRNLPPYMLHDPLKYELPYYRPIVNHYERAQIAKRVYLGRTNRESI